MKTMMAAAAAALALCLSAGAQAQNRSMLDTFKFDKPAFVHNADFAEQKLVVQVSDDRPGLFAMALNNIQNVMHDMGAEKVHVVLVAYGPGLKMLLKDSPVADRIAAMDKQGVEFDACHNTMEGMAKASGHMPELAPAAVIVPAGVTRIMQLQQSRFLYLRP